MKNKDVIEKPTLTKEAQEYLAQCGRMGGSATSDAKVKASRANGKLGGRPRKGVGLERGDTSPGPKKVKTEDRE